MFTHVRLGTNDIEKSRAFYDATLGALGIARATDLFGMLMYANDKGRLLIGPPLAGAATHANGGTVSFAATTTGAVDAFHAAGLAAGGTSEGEPGPRANNHMYVAYLRDPDGNKISALTHAS